MRGAQNEYNLTFGSTMLAAYKTHERSYEVYR
jgi:hypothetical protein